MPTLITDVGNILEGRMVSAARPVGYQYLMETQGLEFPPLYRPGTVDRVRTITRDTTHSRQHPHAYPESMWPGEGLMPHLRFALRQEGVLSAVLLELARQVDLPPVFLAELEASVCQGAYNHKLTTGHKPQSGVSVW